MSRVHIIRCAQIYSSTKMFLHHFQKNSMKNASTPDFKTEVCGYWHKIPNNTLMTKKRFLARLRVYIDQNNDTEYKRFYERAIETRFKSIMREDLRVTVNF